MHTLVRIAEFNKKLSHSVQALETMGKLDYISGIRGDLVRTDSRWETWDFAKLTEALKQWVRRNPISASERDETFRKQVFHARENSRDGGFKPRGGVFCVD